MHTLFVIVLLSLPKIGAYAIFALGIVLMYRASRILNLAHGAMAMVPAYLCYTMVQAGVPIAFALPFGVLSGAALGVFVERLFIQRLAGEGPTVQTVSTVAALGVLVAVAAKVWGTTPLPAPRVFPESFVRVGNSGIRGGEIGLFVVMLLVTGALVALFRFTDIGLYIRGAAENKRAASLMGVDPQRITDLVWAMGGGLAALSGILLAGVTNLHPYTLTLQALPAFVAVLLGGLDTVTGGVRGAVIVGLTLGAVPFLPAGGAEGAPQLFLAALALVVMATRGERLVGSDIRSGI
ncbi:MAG: branched-chain amino acid ABC transporter permease [Actinomycetota bacterium]|nr:branched-chain amino acid ABC transporter permease [Actinomycetota bacterium]